MPEQVEKGIYRISVPIPLEYSPVNVYLLTGRIPTLIDAAFNAPQVWEFLQREVRAAGVDISEIKQVLLTHGHIDHCGLTEEIRQVSGARIVMHHKEWDGVQAFQDPPKELEALMKKQFALWGIPALRQLEILGFRERLRGINRVSPEGLYLVEEGDQVQAGEYELQVVHCPGHTPGQAVWYAREPSFAFTGDHVLKNISPNPDLYLPPQSGSWSGLPDYLVSLTKVAGLDIALCFPGHGEEVTDLKSRVEQIRLGHEERKERILELFAGESLTLNDLTLRFLEDIGRKADAPTFFLALRETFGHLYLLGAEGRLKSGLEQGVILYSGA